jgi:uncharacterized membrane protein YiaA
MFPCSCISLNHLGDFILLMILIGFAVYLITRKVDDREDWND